MKYVLDASVGFKWVIPETHSDKAIRLRDCLYVALAERENCEFVTADSRLANAISRQFPLVVDLSSLP